MGVLDLEGKDSIFSQPSVMKVSRRHTQEVYGSAEAERLGVREAFLEEMKAELSKKQQQEPAWLYRSEGPSQGRTFKVDKRSTRRH